MEKQDVKPHKWAKEIIAWANGAKIEEKVSTRLGSKWNITSSPAWDNSYWEFRIYDPLREVKEAFERGETIQGRMDNFSIWNDYSKSLGTISVESIKDSNGWKWRVKPVNKLEVGKDYISTQGDILIINRNGERGNLGFDNEGNYYKTALYCNTPELWREATKEEVRGFFEKHLIERYGDDWKSVKIKECMHHGDEYINEDLHFVDIDKYSDSWVVWNKNGCLFNGKEWAEVLEEEEIEIDDWKVCDNFGEKVFRHFIHFCTSTGSTGNNLKWRKATKQEVLKAPNYDGTATHQEFPFEVGDKVIARWAERPEVLTVKESVGKHKFKYEECAEGSYIDAGTDTWCYATEQEINPPKEVLYVPFEEEDKEQFRGKWIKRKDGDIEMKVTRFGTLSTNTFLIEGKCSKYLFENFTFLDGTPFGKVK